MLDFLNRDREPMSNVDTAWLRMERPTNLMMITGVVVFEDRVSVEALRETIRHRFLSFPRFNRRPVERAGAAYWERDPHFDITVHVRRTALPGAADKQELQQLVSDLASTPLDPTKPLWQFHLVENYVAGSALIARIHHCYADGIALIQVMLSMTDDDPAAPEPSKPRRKRTHHLSMVERLLEPANRGLSGMVKLGRNVLTEGAQVARDPGRLKTYAGFGMDIAGELAAALLLPDDAPTRFKGPLGVRKQIAWAPPIPLDEVKTVARALDCTVNDVLLASVTGALRAYLVEQGDSVDGLAIRATVPVNLRPLEHAKDLGNRFGLVFLALPVGISNPVERLYQVKRDMQALKSSKQAFVTFGALAALGLAPAQLQHPALERLSKKATAVMTNVPGPQKALYMAGSRIDEFMFWVPQSGSIGMGVSILSYDGRVQFGLVTDEKRVPKPDDIVGRFAGEFEKLLLTALMEPWDERRPANEVEASVEAGAGATG